MDDKERIQMQAREARATSIREHSVAKRKLQEEAETVTEEVTEATRLASTQTYEAYEPILKDIKADITIEKRRQDLPGYVSDDISKLRSTRQALQSEREAGRGDIRDQSKAALASIKSQLLSGETQIEASEKSALSSIESQEAEILAERAESFELDTGELVDKAKYNELSQEEKEYINTKGADKFNKWQEDKESDFKREI